MSFFFLYDPKFWPRGGFKGGGSHTVHKPRKKKEKKLKKELLAKIKPMPVLVVTQCEAIPEVKVSVEERYLQEDLDIAFLIGLL